jgi:F-type H+-transporting ATPase subunit delta
VAANEVARVYASALLDIGQERKILSQLEEELGFVAKLLDDDRDLVLFFNAPGVTKDSKKAFVDRIFNGQLSEISINFLKILIDNNRQLSIRDIHLALIEFIDELNNRQRVQVVASTGLSAEATKKIKDALEKKFSKEIIIEEVVDEAIIGGIVIKIGDLVIDGSLAKDLKNIREKLLSSKVRSEAAYED